MPYLLVQEDTGKDTVDSAHSKSPNDSLRPSNLDLEVTQESKNKPDVSSALDLEKRHNEQLVIRDISDIVQNHAAHHFDPYIVYCSNETFQQRTLQKLLNNNSAFKETLKEIEKSSECGGLPMLSFLILPMQRVTRLPLLLDTICQKTQAQTAEYFAAVWALKAMSKLVTECNDGARRMERTEQMYTIQKQMDFGKIKPFPLVSASRWVKKRGELAISSEELSIWRAFANRSYYLFLFNDVLIVTKKKS
ncbi:Rho guanine nucleotide exchange factor 16 [Ilyodon furcidens]|uniref:Rho guanine nucleotide exchange factor 16 n=1 Tax=Ilyodon furcidens TaxID=33524 RepID=A0ABV0UAJ3_9TELE